MSLNRTAAQWKKYHEDLRLEVKFHETIKGLLGQYFFKHTNYMDMNCGTDLFTTEAHRVNCRVRRYEFWNPRFANEFSVRWKRWSGAPT